MFRSNVAPVRALVLATALGACSATSTSLGPNEIAGSYRLVSIYGMALPAESFPGRVTVDSGSMEFGAGGDMQRDEFGTLCVLGSCSAFHDQFLGHWTLAQRNQLVLSYSTGGVDSNYVAGPGYIILTYQSEARREESKRWNKR